MDLEVSSPRPLADAARLLEQRFHRVVTYEDAPYAHPDDMIRDDASRLIPRGGRIAVQYEEADDLPRVLEKILDAHARLKHPGVFAVEHLGNDYHIVPRAFRNDRGAPETRLPLMDTTISAPAGASDGLRRLEEIVRSLSTTRGETVSLGTVPINALAQHRVGSGESKGRVRDLLVGLFRAMDRHASWQLLNDPGTSAFVLNIHEVPEG